MPDFVFLAKLISSVSIVVLLSWVAEHVSPKVAGLLSGYPLGAAIALSFYGLEMSPEFASKSAVYTIIRNSPRGLGSLITYSLTVSIVYPVCGVYLGTLISFTIATAYLLIYYFMTARSKGLRKTKLTNPLSPLRLRC